MPSNSATHSFSLSFSFDSIRLSLLSPTPSLVCYLSLPQNLPPTNFPLSFPIVNSLSLLHSFSRELYLINFLSHPLSSSPSVFSFLFLGLFLFLHPSPLFLNAFHSRMYLFYNSILHHAFIFYPSPSYSRHFVVFIYIKQQITQYFRLKKRARNTPRMSLLSHCD